MKDLNRPLTDAELHRLDRFLLDRIGDDEDTDGKDEGILDVSELDGFFTALVSGPVALLPSQWLPAVWGDQAPVWRGEREFEAVFSLMIRHMNGIAATLMHDPQAFEPLFRERVVDGKTYTIVDEWCEGYLRGVAQATEAWRSGGAPMEALLEPIRAFTRISDWRAHDLADAGETERLRAAITPGVREIHAFWLKRRGPEPAVARLPHRAGPRPGRNDPCPCGSGRKFKKCCGAAGPTVH